ncbi:histidine kinase [Neobacillus bataviensis LMG 21833]|uniref:histidine kinase n=1 Tax=Neobacillus bataviensis LMG 21833 TaxID=1117379 RepID=K6DCU1_9BACI|nr:ATP-binding protein [Neobacillus bataviensis]EKN66109.1 histidine kinase [Neobacillus bataviensis LMG 21833]
MKEGTNSPKLIYEEKKAIKLFLWLFNVIFFLFDIFYFYIYPFYTHENYTLVQRDGLGVWLYCLIIALLLIALYFLKKGNPYIIKYIYILSYFCIDIVDNLLRYAGTTKTFASGNIVEILFILFCPIFVNKKYFWVVAVGLISKNVIIGVVLQTFYPLFPAMVFFVLSLIAYILLTRFNSYINSLSRVYEELHKKEKLAVVGQMATAIGHEIRNPLSSLKGFTQLQQERNPVGNEFYPIMIQEIDRINSIVDDLMYLGKPKEITFENARIEEIITYTLSITNHQAEGNGITVETAIAEPLPPLECDAQQLKQVFLNLIKNAIESMPGGGRIQILIKSVEKHKIYISIQDEGCGIANENLPNLGEPFFTTKKDGTGLGLLVTTQIIKDHNGELNIESEIGKGTKVDVVLPMSQGGIGKK